MRGARALVIGLGAACGTVDAPAIDAAGSGDGGVDAPTDVFTVVRQPPTDRPIGFLDAAGAGPALVFNNQGRAAQCRAGNLSVVDGAAFASCGTADASGQVTFPIVASAGATDGSYRVDVEYLDAAGQTQTYATTMYLHRSLDGAQRCDDGAEWPSDAAFFTAAIQPFSFPAAVTDVPSWAASGLPHATPFVNTDLTMPTYTVGFVGVSRFQLTSRYAIPTAAAGVTLSNPLPMTSTVSFDLPMLSLRHRIVTNAEGTLLLVHRSYESRTVRRITGSTQCRMGTFFGRDISSEIHVDCDAFVLNAAGEGFCMQTSGGVVQQAVYSRRMVAKLMSQTVGDQPAHPHDSVWGPKVMDATGVHPDSVFELNQRPFSVILRP
ncbi:MAG: hypothetical protein R2939_16240 [Kofleriaceae bacterium]